MVVHAAVASSSPAGELRLDDVGVKEEAPASALFSGSDAF